MILHSPITPDATAEDVRHRYHELTLEYHPDRLTSKGLPPDLVEFAQQKLARINAAYERVKNGWARREGRA